MSVIVLLQSQIPCANSFYRYFQNFRVMQRIQKLGYKPKVASVKNNTDQ